MTHRQRVREAYLQYLNKWGFEKYNFYCHEYERENIYAYPKMDMSVFGPYSSLVEIKCLHTLLNRVKTCKGVKIYDTMRSTPKLKHRFIEFASFDEFKTYTLIEKLGFMKYG